MGSLPWSLLKQKNSFEMWLITPYLGLRSYFLHLRLFPNEPGLDSCLLPWVTNGARGKGWQGAGRQRKSS